MSASLTGKVRFGLIGCGDIAVHTAKSIERVRGVARITAVQDIVPALARDMGQRFSVPWHTRAEDLLARDDVDAVVISTPHFLHAPLTVQAARAGKHVVCEKPIACTLAQADRMIAACREAGVLLTILHTTGYCPAVFQARELVRRGAIGEVIGYRIHRYIDKPESYWTGGYSGRAQTDWRQSKVKSGGGVFMMNVIHDFEQMNQIVGLRPVRIFAESDTHCTPVEVEDHICAVVRFANGAIGNFTAMSCARGCGGNAARILGTHGQIQLDKPVRVYTTKRGLKGLPPKAWHELPEKFLEDDLMVVGREYLINAAARAILSGDFSAASNALGARRNLTLVLAAYESAEKHRPVAIKDW